jgi:hypothetical protein
MNRYPISRHLASLRWTAAVSLQVVSIGLQSLCASDASARQPFLDHYCLPCHSQKLKTAGIILENSDPEHPASHPQVWEKVLGKLDSREMPPAGMPRPDAASARLFEAGIISDLDNAARKTPYAGRTVVRRYSDGAPRQAE